MILLRGSVWLDLSGAKGDCLKMLSERQLRDREDHIGHTKELHFIVNVTGSRFMVLSDGIRGSDFYVSWVILTSVVKSHERKSWSRETRSLLKWSRRSISRNLAFLVALMVKWSKSGKVCFLLLKYIHFGVGRKWMLFKVTGLHGIFWEQKWGELLISSIHPSIIERFIYSQLHLEKYFVMLLDF